MRIGHKTNFTGRAVWAGLALTLWMVALTGQVTAAPGEVNVYSYRQSYLIKPLFSAFTRETGIKVNVVFARQGMTERIRREGRNSPADMIFTVDIGRLNDALQAGILQGVRTPKLLANVPPAYRHPQGMWYGLTLRARVILASKARVPRGSLRTYEALANGNWKGRVCTRSSQHVYNVALLASMVAHHGASGAEKWARGLLKNLARKPQGNDRAQVAAIKAGECDVALVNHYYLGLMLNNPKQSAWAEAVYLIFPNQQGRGAHVNITGAGIAKYAPNRANAVRLLEFLTGTLAQRMYAEQNYEYPVNPKAPWPALLTSWGRFKADDLKLDVLAKHRSLAIRIFDRVGFP